jgi:hypothetical protein
MPGNLQMITTNTGPCIYSAPEDKKRGEDSLLSYRGFFQKAMQPEKGRGL